MIAIGQSDECHQQIGTVGCFQLPNQRFAEPRLLPAVDQQIRVRQRDQGLRRPGFARQQWGSDPRQEGGRLIEKQRPVRTPVNSIQVCEYLLGQRDLLVEVVRPAQRRAQPLRDMRGQPVGSLGGEERTLLPRHLRQRLKSPAGHLVDESLVHPRDELSFPHPSLVATRPITDPMGLPSSDSYGSPVQRSTTFTDGEPPVFDVASIP